MRLFLPFALLFLLLSHHGFGQAASTRLTPEQFGYRHLVVMFGRDSVHVLVQSKKGEEKVKKPLLLGVPVFIGYGSLDKAVLSNDYLRLESMRLHKTTITFRDYPGREHNFFSLKNGQPDYDEDYWPVVGRDFLRWAGLWPQ